MDADITTEELIHRLEEHLTAEGHGGLIDPALPPFKRFSRPRYLEDPYLHYFC